MKGYHVSLTALTSEDVHPEAWVYVERLDDETHVPGVDRSGRITSYWGAMVRVAIVDLSERIQAF